MREGPPKNEILAETNDVPQAIKEKAGEMLYEAEMIYGDFDRDTGDIYVESVIGKMEEYVEEFTDAADHPEDISEWVAEKCPGWKPEDFRLLVKELKKEIEQFRSRTIDGAFRSRTP